MPASRRHQWGVIVVYGLTDAEAQSDQVRLDAERRLSVDGPACLNCELAWSPELATRPCSSPWYRVEQNNLARVTQA